MARTPEEILGDVKRLAVEYLAATGKPLGATGEIAEYEAFRTLGKLGLRLAGVRMAGYNATIPTASGVKKVQIKGRRIPRGGKPGMVPSIDPDKDFDAVLLVILDAGYDATEIREAPRDVVETALLAPGSKARNERHQLAVRKFRSISTRVWP